MGAKLASNLGGQESRDLNVKKRVGEKMVRQRVSGHVLFVRQARKVERTCTDVLVVRGFCDCCSNTFGFRLARKSYRGGVLVAITNGGTQLAKTIAKLLAGRKKRKRKEKDCSCVV